MVTRSSVTPSHGITSAEKPTEPWRLNGVASVGEATSFGGFAASPGSWFGGSGWPGWKNEPSGFLIPFGSRFW
jgi:hypothetical protein